MSFSGTHLLCPSAFLWKEEPWANGFSPSHHRTPADTTGQINIAAVICNTSTKPPELLCTLDTFPQTFAVSFSVFCHISFSSGALIFVFSWTKRRICRDEVKRGRCACVSDTFHTLPELPLPELSHFCGTFLSWGCLGEQAEGRRAQGARNCWSLQSPQNFISWSAKSHQGYKQGPNPLLPLPLSFKI